MTPPLSCTRELFMKVLISYHIWLRNKVLNFIYNFCKILTRFLENLDFYLIEITSSMLDEIESKTVHNNEEGNRQGKQKTQSEVKRVESTSKNLQCFLEISTMQKKVLRKLQDHAYEQQNFFGLRKDNLSQRNCQNQLRQPSSSHIEHRCQESLIQGKILIQQNWNKGLEYS